MKLGTKNFAKPFCPFSCITKEEKEIINKVLKGDIEDIYTYVVQDNGLLFTLGYYVNCRPEKISEITQLLNQLERP